jgi:PAS domain S-box-containing protein
MINESQNKQVLQNDMKKAWEDFVLHSRQPRIKVRKEILNSWKKCLDIGLDPLKPPVFPNIGNNDLQILLEQYNELIDLAKPLIEMIKISVSGTGFILTLTDSKGVVLEVVGDKSTLKRAERNHYIPGCIRNTKTSGTNAIGLCLDLGRPIQVTGAEHFNIYHHPWTCSSSPIKDTEGNLTGVITLSGNSYRIHKHTIALVTTAAKSIEAQLRERYLIDKTQRLNSILTTIHNSISDGFIAINGDRLITHVNNAASRMLGRPKEDIVGQHIDEFIVYDDKLIQALQSGEHLETSEIFFKYSSTTKKHFMCRVDPIYTSTYKQMGNVLIVAEKRQMINIAKRIGGNYAKYEFSDIKGQSPKFLRQIKMAKLASQTNSRILITGESGTGKELFAQAIHNHSYRKNGPFVAISCAAIPRNLIESELFGYKGGAFTGARQKGMTGKFELANSGTLFLDEINGLPLEIQTKLLRALQQNEIMRLGDTSTLSIDVRIIAASNTDLMDEVENGNFREDLYYRLNVMEIIIPPLRERIDDLDLLIDHIISRHCDQMGIDKSKISPEALTWLKNYTWPGNIRELENVLERALLLSQGKIIDIDHFPLRRKKAAQIEPSKMTMNEGMKQLILSALKNNNWNISQTAKELNISRGTLYRRLKQYQITQ